ncbi:hypothetical protein BKA63DRAFT_81047 [Paraphoma chrysanthemicola]|nr:hypothetical protein BKA63DRAFT_81047 [Paraphoma chrysanthemicola]
MCRHWFPEQCARFSCTTSHRRANASTPTTLQLRTTLVSTDVVSDGVRDLQKAVRCWVRLAAPPKSVWQSDTNQKPETSDQDQTQYRACSDTRETTIVTLPPRQKAQLRVVLGHCYQQDCASFDPSGQGCAKLLGIKANVSSRQSNCCRVHWSSVSTTLDEVQTMCGAGLPLHRASSSPPHRCIASITHSPEPLEATHAFSISASAVLT